MRALLVNPRFPDSYWSGRRALSFAGKRSLLPPLSLLTVAALLPQDWDLELLDEEIEPVPDAALAGADLVMLTGMIVQKTALHELLERCRRLGVKTVVGGPYATALPQELDAADHLVLGEGENTIPRFACDFAAKRAERIYREDGKPDLSEAPVPRYDLLQVDAYHQLSLQYSRGCPFTCEFCDIIVMYGRTPRTKTTAQILAELEAIRGTGFTGDVFFVDDNFIGNKKHLKEMLPAVTRWRRETEAPLDFYTEASLNLADDEKLVDMMTEAGFTSVFIGIESPSEAALRETKKLQNLRRDIASQVHWLLEKGLDVFAGFILGFDSDDETIFDRMIEFVGRAAVPYAMVGMLGALPNTPLYARLEKEGRLREDQPGDQFGMTNVVTKIPEGIMAAGYRRVMEVLYSPEVFFQRCRDNLRHWNPRADTKRGINIDDLRAGLRAIWGQGVRSSYRRIYWRFLRWVVKHQPAKLPRALAQAAAGHHYITYTREVVVPALRERQAALMDSAERHAGAAASFCQLPGGKKGPGPREGIAASP